ncbi:MAG: hypothetical protein NBV61_07260 [Algoriphagus sp.]|nr:hypothetical protein [Algoriphagus sp.]
MNQPRHANFKRISLLIFLGMVVSLGYAQTTKETASFEIVVLGIKIGNLTAQKTGRADSVLYSVDSRVKFWFFGDLDIKFLTRSNFKAGKMIKSFSESKTNRGNFDSKVNWTGTYYQVDAKSYKYANRATLKGPLSWCSTKLFFHEPIGQELFLSEVYGISVPIKKIRPGVYEIEVEGNTNQYFYQGGELVKIVVESPIKDYQVRRVN